LGLGVEIRIAMDLQPIHPEPTSFLRKWVFSTDHKVIARQFLWTGLIFLFIGGMLAMSIRWQWGFPGQPLPLGKLFPRSREA
jgi:cytochrome c oxidase subunit 1